MRIFALALLGLALAGCSPPASPVREVESPSVAASAPASSAAEFQSADGNLGCIYTPAGGTDVYKTADGAAELKCDRMAPNFARVVLPEHGAASVVETQERGCCAGEVLADGAHWAAGPFQCDVAASGLTCTSGEGHGFTLGPERAETH